MNPSCAQNAQLIHAKAGVETENKWVSGFQLMGQQFSYSQYKEA
jgi:hypothetical protein